MSKIKKMGFLTACNKIIEYSFYAIFFLVPLIFAADTSELFELNKMWLTWGFAIIIGVAWGSKIVAQKKLHIQRTPLDIPLGLFVLSQIISTLFSLDQHVSWWGYYSRFNGGLLSTLTYVFLYYAFVSNLELKQTLRLLSVSLVAGLCAALWGFPAHYGYDPTCLVFRGTFDTSCWTDAFKPTVRTFSTLGQPAWFAAYMALLIPIAMAGALAYALNKKKLMYWIFFAIAMFFYINLNFANTRAGLLGFWAANIVFWGFVFFKNLLNKQAFIKSFSIFTTGFLLCNFFFGGPLGQFYSYTLPGITVKNAAKATSTPQTPQQPAAPTAESAATTEAPIGGGGGTDSAIIRQYVWEGALNAWRANPVFGTGAETFAFAYYKHKPAGHNLTSEWDYLYNKAHNEYLNYLATTGIFGLVSYLAFIALFLLLTFKWLLKRDHGHEAVNDDSFAVYIHHRSYLVIGLLAGFVSILVTNFFGFSVVITNLYLFFMPLLIFIIAGMLKESHAFKFAFSDNRSHHINGMQWTFISIIIFIGLFLSWQLINYRSADIAYALGNNLDKVGSYQEAHPLLRNAVSAVPNEPVFKDELAINLATLSTAMQQQEELKQQAVEARTQAIALSDEVTSQHPNNITYWKNRVRIFYTLAQTDPENQTAYLTQAANSIMKAAELAPNDAKVMYNLGVLYGQTGNPEKGIEVLKRTTELKPDYRDAYYALGLFYHEKSLNAEGKVVDATSHDLAIKTYEYILEKLSPNDKQVQETLTTWKNL